MCSESDVLSIILHIGNGANFDLKIGSLILKATLSGNSLETKPVQSSAKVEFNNNLIWETDKRSVKRMKTENLPIKLECFLKMNRCGKEITETVGHILIPIRGVPITYHDKPLLYGNKKHWQKLVGLNSEWKKRNPELSLCISITDKVVLSDLDIHEMNGKRDSCLSPTEKCPDTSDLLTSQKGLYIELMQDAGFLQIGDTLINFNIFIVELEFTNARIIFQESTIFEKNEKNLSFIYNLLGTSAHSILKGGDGLYEIHEKITINFKTSIQSLKEYFENIFYIPAKFFCNNLLIGSTSMKFNNVINFSSLNEFLGSCNINNTYKIEGNFTIPGVNVNSDIKVKEIILNYLFVLKYLESDYDTLKLDDMKSSIPKISDDNQNLFPIDENQKFRTFTKEKKSGNSRAESNLSDLNGKTFDISNEVSNEEKEKIGVIEEDRIINRNNLEKIETQKIPGEEINAFFTQTRGELVIKTDKNDENTKTEVVDLRNIHMESNKEHRKLESDCKSMQKTFSFNVILQTIKFNRRPELGIWQISLQHQNADTIYSITNVELKEISSYFVEFKNLKLQLLFSSTTDDISNLISSHPCILAVTGPRGMHAFAELNTEALLNSLKEKISGVILLENQNSEKCIMAQLIVYIEEIGLNFNTQTKKFKNTNAIPTPRAYLDERLAYSMVEELEDWKQIQEQNFLASLKQKEVKHLTLLSTEWENRKADLENQLERKLQQCQELRQSLEDAHRLFKQKQQNNMECAKSYQNSRNELEQKYSKLINELNEKIKELQVDMEQKINNEILKFKQLELEKLHIEKEKVQLQKELNELRTENENLKTSYIPREQVKILVDEIKSLKNQISELQRSKEIYKCQWAKVTREIQKIKSHSGHSHISDERTEHCRTGLHCLLINEENEFNNERAELNVLKAALEDWSEEEDCSSYCEE